MGQSQSLINLINNEQYQTAIDYLSMEEKDENLPIHFDEENRSPLHYAVAKSHAELVRKCISVGFSIDMKDVRGRTPLHVAVFQASEEMTRLLVDLGADLNVVDSEGMTPLHWAVYEGHVACAEILVERGANVDSVNSNGKSVMDTAKALKGRKKVLFDILRGRDYILETSNPDFENVDRLEKLSGLSTLWGLIKYTHPFLAYKNDINWNDILVQSVQDILNGEDYKSTIKILVDSLDDPNTYVYEEKTVENIEIEENVRTQPYVEISRENVAVIVLTDYSQFITQQKLSTLKNSLESARNSAKALIFDVRCRNQNINSSASYLFVYIFEEAFSIFLNEDLPLPTKRQRVWNGCPEYKKGYGQIFYHGMITIDADIIPKRATNEVHQYSQKPMCFIVDRHTPQRIIDIAIGLQSKNLASIIYISEASENSNIFEPSITSSIIVLPENISVYVRQNEIISPNGSIGFNPNLKIESTSELSLMSTFSDPVIKEAVKMILSGENWVSMQNYIHPQIRQDSFSDIQNPSKEERTLALFHLWNTIHYFYAHKDENWNEKILQKYIPLFLDADNDLDYVLAVAFFVKELKDTNAFVKSEVLSDYIGTHSPPLKLKHIDQKIVVADVFNSHDSSTPVGIGDFVKKIDGVIVDKRIAELTQIFGGSNKQAIRAKVDLFLLSGKQNSTISIELETRTGDLYTVALPRVVNPRNLVSQLFDPTYLLLSELDARANRIGYIDAGRLISDDVKGVMELMKNSTSIILDLRGNSRVSLYELFPFFTEKHGTVATAKIPFVLPGSLTENLEPSYNYNVQKCRPTLLKNEQFSGTLVALVDESTLSHGQTSCLYFKSARDKFVTVGTPTNGGLGAVSNIALPGGILVGFSGTGVRRSGENIRETGVLPDVLVEEKLEKMTAEDDVYLMEAIKYLQTN